MFYFIHRLVTIVAILFLKLGYFHIKTLIVWAFDLKICGIHQCFLIVVDKLHFVTEFNVSFLSIQVCLALIKILTSRGF